MAVKPGQEGTARAILFADICGSTRLYELHGNRRAYAMIEACLTALAQEAGRRGGRLCKSLGDGILCTFDETESAVRAAAAMADPEGKLPVRVGLHYGAVIEDANDVFGDAVNVASRVTGLAYEREVILTEAVVARLSPLLQANARPIDLTEVRGKAVPVRIFGWREDADDEATSILGLTSFKAESSLRSQLRLGHGGQAYPVVGDQPFVLGREPTCDLVVTGSLVSRRHAVITALRGSFQLQDTSTNGTYVRLGDGTEVALRRDEAKLHGEGIICLGRHAADDPNDPLVIRFRCDP